MIHVRDTAKSPDFYAPAQMVTGQVFNVGADNYQLGALAEIVCATVSRDVRIGWYGDPDVRSYRVSFEKIVRLGWQAERTVQDGIIEVYERLEARALEKCPQRITLDWYKELTRWHEIIKQVELHGGIIKLAAGPERRG